MKKILYCVNVDIFIPLYLQLSNYLQSLGYEPSFVAFSLRENLWLKKNNIAVLPEDVHAVKTYAIKKEILNPQELESVLRFSIIKFGGKRKYWEDRILRIASFLNDLMDKRHIDAVLIWNGEDFIGKILYILANRKGIKTVFGENGYFPKTLQFDTQGVNVYSSITKIPFADILHTVKLAEKQEPVEKNSKFNLSSFVEMDWQGYLKCFWSRKININHYREFPEHRGVSWFSAQWLLFKRRFIGFDKVQIPEKYIFIPFQVHDDTQILLNSKYFKSMEDFFEFSYRTIKKHFGDEYAIVVKEHPEDLCRYSYSKLRKKYPDVIWLRKYNIDRLLDNASYIFVVNSSVGLQAMQRYKPVIVFGDSFYTRDELVFCVQDPAHIDSVVQRAKQGVDALRKTNIEIFIKFLKEEYFVNGGWKDVTVQGIVNAGNKILSLIE